MSDSKKQWTNIPNRKNKKPYTSKRDLYKKESSNEVFPVFKTNNNFQLLNIKNDLNTYSENAFSALAWRKTNVPTKELTVCTNTIKEKAKKGFNEFNSYPILSSSPVFPTFQ